MKMPLAISDEGQVKKLALPESWLEAPAQRPGLHGPSMRSFYRANNAAVRLSFFYRGFRLDEKSGDAFIAILSQPVHALSESEIESIELLLREASEPEFFERRSMKTEILQGRKVLVIEGQWKRDRQSEFGIYIDADGDGRVIQEIHYTAPLELADSYRAEVKRALDTLKWR